MMSDLEFTHNVVKDQEAIIAHMRSTHRDALFNVRSYTQIQIQKIKQEKALIRTQLSNEVELQAKQTASIFQMVAAKIKELSMKQKYESEKYQTAIENKFKKLIQAREEEWEQAWQRRDGLIANKEIVLRDAET